MKDIFKYILLIENHCILIQMSLKFVPKHAVKNKPPSVQIIAWCQTGNKALSESVMAY